MNRLAPDYVLNGLIQRGIPAHIAEGFVMNALDESGLNPGINEAAPIVPGSRGGYGLMQWTGPRRRELEAFAAQAGVPVHDADMQMDFLLRELHGSERSAWDAIQRAQTSGEAGAAIVNRFLRPAEAHRARREASYLGGASIPRSEAEQPYSAPYAPQERRNALAAPMQQPEAPQRPQAPQVGTYLDPREFMAQPMNALAATPDFRIAQISRRQG